MHEDFHRIDTKAPKQNILDNRGDDGGMLFVRIGQDLLKGLLHKWEITYAQPHFYLCLGNITAFRKSAVPALGVPALVDAGAGCDLRPPLNCQRPRRLWTPCPTLIDYHKSQTVRRGRTVRLHSLVSPSGWPCTDVPPVQGHPHYCKPMIPKSLFFLVHLNSLKCTPYILWFSTPTRHLHTTYCVLFHTIPL